MTNIAITGINSYFAKNLLPFLEKDPQVKKIIGIDITPWRGAGEKVTFFREDVRSGRIREFFKDVDTVIHLAFVVREMHNKKKSRDININGSKNVFEACAANGVKKLIYTSSIASYGAHFDNPIGITEDYPLVENEDSYYSSDKVTLEKFLNGFIKAHPEMIITVFRPPIVAGPNLNNFFNDLFRIKLTLFMKGHNPQIQLMHEDDLGESLYLAVTRDIPGIFNLATDDHTTLRKLFDIAGIKVIDLSPKCLKTFVNLLFFFHLYKSSQGWVTLLEYPIVVNNDKFTKVSDWRPKYSSEETFQDFLGAMRKSCLMPGLIKKGFSGG